MIKIVLIVAVSVLLIVSGCLNPTPTPTPSPTATPAETPIATPMPTATPVPVATPAITTTLAAVKPAINVTSYPTSVVGESNFTISWEVSGGSPGNISNTAILWGFNSGGENITDYPRTSTIQTGNTPQQFSVELIAPAGGGPVYFRAHAVVDGVDVYSPEYQIIITPLYTGGGGGGGGGY